MTSIDAAARLAAQIRAQMAGFAQQRPGSARSSDKEIAPQSGTVDTPLGTAGKDEFVGISAAVLAQVRSLSPDDAPRKAFRLYLRASLARQLNQASEGDASFDLLVDQVMAMMAADEQLSDSIQKAGRHLVDLASQS